MLYILLTRLPALMAATLATVPAVAAEPGFAAVSAYRLNIEQPAAYRLTVDASDLPASQSRNDPAISPRLADKPYAALIHSAAQEASLDPALVHAVIFVESRYNPAARSPKGAIGLMQVMPDTALRYGVTDLAHSPEANLRVGTRYLKDLMQQFENRLDLVLAAYNAGENAVVRHGQRIPPYEETRHYVPAVLSKYRELQEPPPAVSSGIEYLPGTRLDPRSVGTVR